MARVSPAGYCFSHVQLILKDSSTRELGDQTLLMDSWVPSFSLLQILFMNSKSKLIEMVNGTQDRILCVKRTKMDIYVHSSAFDTNQTKLVITKTESSN